MALTDINFQEGEGQDFITELPSVLYAGILDDVLVESSGTQYLVLETPEIVGGSGGNIFIMSE